MDGLKEVENIENTLKFLEAFIFPWHKSYLESFAIENTLKHSKVFGSFYFSLAWELSGKFCD